MLRIRKILVFVVEKLNLNKTQQPKSNKASSLSLSDLNGNVDGIKVENWIEILCNDEVRKGRLMHILNEFTYY